MDPATPAIRLVTGGMAGAAPGLSAASDLLDTFGLPVLGLLALGLPGDPGPFGVTCANGSGANDSANLKVQIRVPTNAKSFTYKFKFYSSEFPEWTCTEYNDFYLALLTTTALPIGTMPGQIPPDRNISFDALGNPVSVNNAFFDVCTGQPGCLSTTELVGTGMGGSSSAPTALNDGGGTSWLTTTSPIVPGETMTIEFMTWDTGDRLWDSTVLLDAFEWSINAGTVGTTK
jgi:hypothetical protein